MKREEIELLAGNTDFKYCVLLFYYVLASDVTTCIS